MCQRFINPALDAVSHCLNNLQLLSQFRNSNEETISDLPGSFNA